MILLCLSSSCIAINETLITEKRYLRREFVKSAFFRESVWRIDGTVT
jgi:hypothetical protein